MERPSMETTLMRVADAFAKRSTCSRLQVGAVIADERGVILSSGYNGALSGRAHCDHAAAPTEPCRDAVHAEANAILWAARRGVSLSGAVAYVTHEPCRECAKMIVQAGIRSVFFGEFYGRNAGTALLVESGVSVAGDVR